MPSSDPSLIRFNGGQWSEKLRARTDLEDYDASLEKMDGFIPLKYGEAQAMTGFIHAEETKNNDKPSVFIPFQFSATDSFWLELGDLYMRVVNPVDGTYVEVSGVAAWVTSTAYVIGDIKVEASVNYYCLEDHTSGVFATDLAAVKWYALTDDIFEIPTPYTEAQLYDVQYQNLNDLVVLTHGSHFPREITRFADTNWTISNYVEDYPAFLSENSDDTHFIAASGLTGSVTLSATGTGNEPFDSEQIGSKFALTHERDSADDSIRFTDAQSTIKELAGIKVKGDWDFFTVAPDNPGDMVGVVTLERSTDGGVTYKVLRERTIVGGVPVLDLSGTEEEDDVLYKIKIDGTGIYVPGPNVNNRLHLTTNQAQITGYAEITAVASSISATATTVVDFESTTVTDKWQEGGWSDYQGYPKASTNFEQRMFFGGTTRKPTAVWASATDDISNFDFRTTEANDAFFRVIDNSQNSIQWMARKDQVFIGTSGEEFFLSSSNEAEAITPSNVTVKTSGGNGSAPIKPISLGSSLAFVTLNKIQLRELSFSPQDAQYTSDGDLTELADSITGNGIKQIAYQQYPNRTIYAIRDDGVLLGLVFDKRNDVRGWFTRSTDGEFESIVSTRSGVGINDPLGVVVKRVINGTTKRFIEVLAEPSDTNSDWVYLDGSVNIPTLGGSAVTGLDHLEGKTVSVMNDGALETDKVVVSGAISLDRDSAINVVVGLDFENECITLPIRNEGRGNSKPKKKSISSVLLGVRKSLSGFYGYQAIDDKGDAVRAIDKVYPMDTGDRIMGVALNPVTRYYDLPIEGGNYNEISLVFSRRGPVPLNVTHAIPTLETSSDS